MNEWEFSAQIEDDGDLMLEWYKGKGDVVTVCLNADAHVINWAALIHGVSHHGCIKGYPGLAALGEVKAPSTHSGEVGNRCRVCGKADCPRDHGP